ncbi:MAG: hypothetical protein IID40_07770 [Planctomycetes bacterium]|nr:hypothetical protein [Planctomycetota bacterium]
MDTAGRGAGGFQVGIADAFERLQEQIFKTDKKEVLAQQQVTEQKKQVEEQQKTNELLTKFLHGPGGLRGPGVTPLPSGPEITPSDFRGGTGLKLGP